MRKILEAPYDGAWDGRCKKQRWSFRVMRHVCGSWNLWTWNIPRVRRGRGWRRLRGCIFSASSTRLMRAMSSEHWSGVKLSYPVSASWRIRPASHVCYLTDSVLCSVIPSLHTWFRIGWWSRSSQGCSLMIIVRTWDCNWSIAFEYASWSPSTTRLTIVLPVRHLALTTSRNHRSVQIIALLAQ